MRALLTILTTLLLLASPLAAIEGPASCTADLLAAVEAQGLTCVSGEILFLVRVGSTDTLTAQESAQLLIDAYAIGGNYQPEIPCEAERDVDDAGVWRAAGPGDGTCDSGTVGQQITNPQTDQDAAKLLMRSRLIRESIERQRRLNVEAAEKEPVDKPGVRGGPPK